ncbi:MAG: DUF4132 domain-containing protein [Planctomycetes bacterium]|nr:DUF4132 domain-containing protein [Planctomycetota bacterium]
MKKTAAPAAGGGISSKDAGRIVERVVKRVPKDLWLASELTDRMLSEILRLPEADQRECVVVLAETIGELQHLNNPNKPGRSGDALWKKKRAPHRIGILEKLLRRRTGYSASQIERIATALVRGDHEWATWSVLVPLLLQGGKDGTLTPASIKVVRTVIAKIKEHPLASDRKRIAALTKVLQTARPHGGGGEPRVQAPRAAEDRSVAVARGASAYERFRGANAGEPRLPKVELKGMKEPELITGLTGVTAIGAVLAAAKEYGVVAESRVGLPWIYHTECHPAAVAVMNSLLRKGLAFTAEEFAALSGVFAKFRKLPTLLCPHYGAFVIATEKWATHNALPQAVVEHLRAIAAAFRSVGVSEETRHALRVEAVLKSKGFGDSVAARTGPLEAILVDREKLPKNMPPSYVDAMDSAMIVPEPQDDRSATRFAEDVLGDELRPVVKMMNDALQERLGNSGRSYEQRNALQQRGAEMRGHGWKAAAAIAAGAAAMSARNIKSDRQSQRAAWFHEGIQALCSIAQGCVVQLKAKGVPASAGEIGELGHALSRLKSVGFMDIPWDLIGGAIAERARDAINNDGGKIDVTAAVRILRFRERLARATDPSDRGSVMRFDGTIAIGLGLPMDLGECWSDRAFADLNAMNPNERNTWVRLLEHVGTLSTGSPTASWLKNVGACISELPGGDFERRVTAWFPLVGKRRPPMPGGPIEGRDSSVPSERGADVLRGLAAAAARFDRPDVATALGDLAMVCFKMVPGVGARCPKPGNSAVWALSRMKSVHALTQLSRVRQLVKFGSAKKSLDRALAKLAAELKVTVDELHEIAAPDFGLGPGGSIEEEAGEFTIRTEVRGAEVVTRLIETANGVDRKSIPGLVKAEFGASLKEHKRLAEEIGRVLPAQKARIERLYLDGRTWNASQWRGRYIDHPLVGTIGRRLIWSFTRGGRTREGLWTQDGFIDERGKPVDVRDSDTVALWHPITADPSQVHAWRGVLEDRRIVQPFKQAHREIYPLTDAEQRTRTYSNRFAAHIFRQNQLVPLVRDRGWKYATFVMDSGQSPRLEIPSAGLHARYEVNSTGDETYGDAYAWLYLETDRVHFSRTAEGPDLPLEEIPPLIFSEVMRDVDLFVAVCSVGNNPEWNDGGPQGRYRQYWHDFSFGELSGSAVSRRETLQRLVPRLAIAPVCTVEDRFLKVRGTLRRYKIHLGSGNILMEPNDQYLCIVPRSVGDAGNDIFLPFEGDRVLSIILSKAFMLAEDDKIKDESIKRQL